MIHLRFSISTLMFVILVLAVNLSVGGPFYGPTGMEGLALLTSGALPMANILAVGLVVLMKRPTGPRGGRRFLAGFEAFGAAALFFYIACAQLFPEAIHRKLGDLLIQITWRRSPMFSWSLMALCLLPQLLVALLGGWLNARYRIVRREDAPPGGTPAPRLPAPGDDGPATQEPGPSASPFPVEVGMG
jgi:hypothetical protein